MSVWVECVARTLITLPCAIDSGTYPYGVKVGEPLLGCEVLNLFQFCLNLHSITNLLAFDCFKYAVLRLEFILISTTFG